MVSSDSLFQSPSYRPCAYVKSYEALIILYKHPLLILMVENRRQTVSLSPKDRYPHFQTLLHLRPPHHRVEGAKPLEFRYRHKSPSPQASTIPTTLLTATPPSCRRCQHDTLDAVTDRVIEHIVGEDWR